jgi:hypothetical protein
MAHQYIFQTQSLSLLHNTHPSPDFLLDFEMRVNMGLGLGFVGLGERCLKYHYFLLLENFVWLEGCSFDLELLDRFG